MSHDVALFTLPFFVHAVIIKKGAKISIVLQEIDAINIYSSSKLPKAPVYFFIKKRMLYL